MAMDVSSGQWGPIPAPLLENPGLRACRCYIALQKMLDIPNTKGSF